MYPVVSNLFAEAVLLARPVIILPPALVGWNNRFSEIRLPAGRPLSVKQICREVFHSTFARTVKRYSL